MRAAESRKAGGGLPNSRRPRLTATWPASGGLTPRRSTTAARSGTTARRRTPRQALAMLKEADGFRVDRELNGGSSSLAS